MPSYDGFLRAVVWRQMPYRPATLALSMREVRLRFRHGCDINQLSQRHPDVVMAGWCNFTLEVLEVHAGREALPPALDEDLDRLGRKGFKRLRDAPGPGGSHLVFMKCAHERGAGVDDAMVRRGCMPLYPVLYQDGWEHYRLIAFEEKGLQALFRDLAKMGQVELLLNKEFKDQLLGATFMVSTGDMLAGLTEKQATALLTAIQEGYYNVPRMVRTEDIARRRKVPRTTFEEHVRKAESKVLLGIAPYLAVHVGAQRGRN